MSSSFDILGNSANHQLRLRIYVVFFRLLLPNNNSPRDSQSIKRGSLDGRIVFSSIFSFRFFPSGQIKRHYICRCQHADRYCMVPDNFIVMIWNSGESSEFFRSIAVARSEETSTSHTEHKKEASLKSSLAPGLKHSVAVITLVCFRGFPPRSSLRTPPPL